MPSNTFDEYEPKKEEGKVIRGYGTRLEIGSVDAAGGESFTTVATVKPTYGNVDTAIIGGVSYPTPIIESLDLTSYSSSNGWREKIESLTKSGEISFELKFKPDLDSK